MGPRRVFAFLVVVAFLVTDFETAPASAAQGKPVVKLEPGLAALASEQRATGHFNAEAARQQNIGVSGNSVVIAAISVGRRRPLARALRKLGLKRAAGTGHMINGLLPVSSLEAASRLKSLRFLRPDWFGTNNVTDQGDTAQRSDLARANFLVDGTGVTVGVLSDSFNCLGGAGADVTSGDLPVVTVVQEQSPCTGGTDEGRAMAQIVHDVAPGSAIDFATAEGGQSNFANNILALQTAGNRVIVDDVFYFAEPWFQDGVVAQAVNKVSGLGSAYFSSAGNQARVAYQSAFRNATDGPFVPTFAGLDQQMDFDPGPGIDTRQSITIPGFSSVNIGVQWSDPFGDHAPSTHGPLTDLDLYALNSSTGAIIISSTLDNLTNLEPFERVALVNSGGSPASFDLVINRFAGPAPRLIKWVDFRGNAQSVDFDTQTPTTNGHANAARAFAVGAAFYQDTPDFGTSPPLAEGFSSAGGTPVLFDIFGRRLRRASYRQAPRFTAPDGADTTFFGSDVEPNGFPNFFGTSAAAPHAAGVAALAFDKNPLVTRLDICNALTKTAVNMDAAGFDRNTGFGLIDANAALSRLHRRSFGPCRRRRHRRR